MLPHRVIGDEIGSLRPAQHLHFLSCPVACDGQFLFTQSTRGIVHGEMSVPIGAMSVFRCIGVVNRNRRGRPRVIHLRLSSASWLNAQSLLHIGHCDETNCGLNKQKPVAMATSLEWSQPNFTPIICAHTATNPENWAKIGLVLSEITGLEPTVKTGSSFGS